MTDRQASERDLRHGAPTKYYEKGTHAALWFNRRANPELAGNVAAAGGSVKALFHSLRKVVGHRKKMSR
ncbi:MAG: hypothetical protein H6Q99_3795 [Proteobacteria bacterium]|nr:hypothetical protein [Pseudomonadota bacterium]